MEQKPPDAGTDAALALKMRAALERVRRSSRQIAHEAQTQALSLHEIVAIAEEAAGELERELELVGEARRRAERVTAELERALRQIGALTESVLTLATLSQDGSDAILELLAVTRRIDEIVEFVRHVSERTNLLALNAAIEAARAGEHGGGFGLVAGEVRKLADSTRAATQEMVTLLGEVRARGEQTREVSAQAHEAVRVSNEASATARAALDVIAGAVRGTVETFGSVASAIGGQAARTDRFERSAETLLRLARSHYAAAAESVLSVNALEYHTLELRSVGRPHGTGTPTLRAAAVNQVGSAAAHTLLRLKTLLQESSGGALQLEVHTGYGQGGRGEMQALMDLRAGTLAFAVIGASIVGNILPEAQLLELPFLLRSREHATRLLDGPYGRGLLERLEEFGLLGFGYVDNGFRHFTNHVRPLSRPADLAQLRIRVQESPVHVYTLDALGAIPTPIPLVKVYRSLERNEVDGQHLGIANVVNMRLYEIERYLTLTGHVYSPQFVIGNAEAFSGLGALAEPARDAIAETIAYGRRISAQLEDDALHLLERRMDVRRPSREQHAAWIAATTPVAERIAAHVGAGSVDEVRAAARAAETDA